jgi:hypothetical protein
MISGTFQVFAGVPVADQHLENAVASKRLSLNTNVKLTLGSRTLSIAVDNSCGAGRMSAIRSSISSEEGGEEGAIVDNPDDAILADALLWLVKGTPCELSKDLEVTSL